MAFSDLIVVHTVLLKCVDTVEAKRIKEDLKLKLEKCRAEYQATDLEVYLHRHRVQENELIGHDKRMKSVPEAVDFKCWMCCSYDTESLESRQGLELLRLIRLIAMVKRNSGGYSRRQVETSEGKRKMNVYSTPNAVVCFLDTILQKLNGYQAMSFIDLGAGEGRLSSILPSKSIAVEIDPNRFRQGRKKVPYLTWLNEDVLSPEFCKAHIEKYDIVVCNPDFEVAMPFIIVALFLLRPLSSSRLFFILPSDFFEASALRARIYKVLPFQIEREYKLGHLNYLDTDPKGQKLSVDSLFVLKRGREKKYRHETLDARLAGML